MLRFLGVDTEDIPPGAEIEFTLTNAPESWGVFLFIGIGLALAYLAWYLYRREIGSAPRWGRALLAGLRIAVIAALLAIFLGPAAIFTQVRSLRPSVALLRDASDSMQIADSYADSAAKDAAARVLGKADPSGESRAAIVNAAVGAPGDPFLQALAERGRVRVIDFAAAPKEVAELSGPAPAEGEGEGAPPAAAVLPPLQPAGPSTDLGRAIDAALEERLTSAIILITDGQHNIGADPAGVAARAAERGVPILAAGVGDPTRPRNLQVAGLYADPQVWKGDPFEIQAVLRSVGLQSEPVEVELIELPADGSDSEGTVLQTRTAVIPEDGGQLPLSFDHTPEEAGPKLFTIRAKAVDGESNLGDNRPPAPARVNVLDDNAKMLLVSGEPSWEYRDLVRLFMREEMVEVSAWLQSLDDGRQQQGDTPINALPATKEELFEYDVVLLLDPNPAGLDEAWFELLQQFVKEHAGGFYFMPGPVYSGQLLSGDRFPALRELLPVELGDVGAMEVEGLLGSYGREWMIAPVPANADHQIARLMPEVSATLALWRTLPGVYWSFPAAAPKPASRVLLEHSDPTLRKGGSNRPLLVAGQFGAGRTVYAGFEGTYRWRTAGDDGEFFQRFWVQAIRYLAEGRALAGKRRGSVESDRYQYEVGDRARLTARLRNHDFSPLEADSVQGVVEAPGSDPQPAEFRPVQGRPGEYEAGFAIAKEGIHRVVITLDNPQGDPDVLDASFSASLPIREAQTAWLDRARLLDLTRLTDGKYFGIDQLTELANSVPDRVRRLEQKSPPIPVWDTGRALFLIALLLTGEWALRKKWKML
ncbi:MAG: hypothetical protein R3F11_16855 [Verrucomicrobiales bacterium]